MGKTSRNPSVEARVVGAKQKLSGSPRRLFSLHLHFFAVVSIFLILFLRLPLLFLVLPSQFPFHKLTRLWSSASFGEGVG